MTDQPEALLRAKEIEEWVKGLTFGVEEVRAATLLREQHAEIERLRAENERLKRTHRDYFAAAALQGLLANPKLHKQILESGQSWIDKSVWGWADAVLVARGKR